MTSELLRDWRAEQRSRTREAILAAAHELALERGPLGTSYGVDEQDSSCDIAACNALVAASSEENVEVL